MRIINILLFILLISHHSYSNTIFSRFFNKKDKINILVVGLDEVVPERADTILLAQIDIKKKHSTVISIPRDTYLQISKNKFDKIAHTYRKNNINFLKSNLENLLGVKIDNYIIIRSSGSEKIIDAIGGVELVVKKRMKYTDKKQNLYIDLHPGKQKLSGEKSLQYLKFRSDKLGDVGRIKRQQKFIKAVLDKTINIKNIPKIPQLIRVSLENTKTDLHFSQLLCLSILGFYIYPKNLNWEVLPGEPYFYNNINYWRPLTLKEKPVILK